MLGASPTNAQPAAPATQVLVIRVVDGDTLDARLVESDRVERIRLIGIDTPETVDPRRGVQCYGREASARTRELALGQTATLELDIEQRDRYGRLLGYIWMADGQMLNAQLVGDGYAQVATYPPNVRYVDRFVQLQRQAREAGLGLWSACGMTSRLATGPPF